MKPFTAARIAGLVALVVSFLVVPTAAWSKDPVNTTLLFMSQRAAKEWCAETGSVSASNTPASIMETYFFFIFLTSSRDSGRPYLMLKNRSRVLSSGYGFLNVE